MSMPEQEINERAQRLLRVLVGKYIQDGKPLGSQTLARAVDMEISSATIRNVMSELEHLGFVDSPHTSAGRVPTEKAYRYFVDSLLKVQDMGENIDFASIQTEVDLNGKDLPGLIDTVSRLLSRLTQLAGVVTLPKREHMVLRHVEFLPISKHRVLVILVTNEWEVENRIINTESDFTAAALEQAANYINETFNGKDLTHARDQLLKELKDARENVNNMMLASLQIAEQAFTVPEDTGKSPFVLHGRNKLLHFSEVQDIDKMRRIFDAFSQKSLMLQLLDQSICAEGLQIFIGQESGYDEMQELSVVTSPYRAEGEIIGVLGVIGPMRMRYDKVIPVVDVTAKLLGAALNQPK